MPTPDPKADGSFYFHGMPIEMADWLPPGVDFAVTPPSQPPAFFALDKAPPSGDYTAVRRVYPSFQIDRGLLDELSEDELKISKQLDIEMRAMREAIHLEATRQMMQGTPTTSLTPGQTPSFRYEDMRRIMQEMFAADRNRKIDEIKTLIAAGFTVTVNEVTKNPIVVLPEDYREAFEEATKPKALWPDRWTPEMLDALRADSTNDKWVKQYLGSFGPDLTEEEDD